MKIIYILLFCCSIFNDLSAQLILNQLDTNSVNATIANNSYLFYNPTYSSAGYEWPKGSTNNVIYMGSFWFCGKTTSGDIRVASNQFYNNGIDYYKGPYSNNSSYNLPAYYEKYHKNIWTVKKEDIAYHIDNYNQPGYVAPESILTWPGNGDTTLGGSYQLAPFVDLNHNGIYEPYSGDYPCIKGDEETFMVFHDNQIHNLTQGPAMGLEIQMILYQFHTADMLDSTTFISLRVINKGNEAYTKFKSVLFLDPDIGFSEDDYIGCDTTRNLAYAYNGYHFDPGQSGAPGYDTIPPAMGVVLLNKQLDFFGSYHRPDISPSIYSIFPDSIMDYWNYANGRFKDGSPWLYGGSGYGFGTPTHFMYSGDPVLNSGWTEFNSHHAPFDQSMFLVPASDTLFPGDTLDYDFAIIVAQKTNHLLNLNDLYSKADQIKNLYQNLPSSCLVNGTGQVDPALSENTPPINNDLQLRITRVDGKGNMKRYEELTPETIDHILDSNSVQKITYEKGKGPIEVRMLSLNNLPFGHFILKFNPYQDVDSANWTIYHYDTVGGNLIDSVNSQSIVSYGYEQIIPQWNMAVYVRQEKNTCANQFEDPNSQCYSFNTLNKPIGANLSFQQINNNWLTGIKNQISANPLNWITSGIYNAGLLPWDSLYPATCYTSNSWDKLNYNNHFLNGIIAPGQDTRVNECGKTPIAFSQNIISFNDVLMTLSQQNSKLLPGIDLYFTNDTSKWTRSPVISLNTSSNSTEKAGFLRQSPSVDKAGNPDGSGFGMGWFPGYAIDVETGRRLNIAFCENSSLISDNGNDMLWNPTERIFDENGNYVLGGQHTIYIFAGEDNGMPKYYDKGKFIHEELAKENSNGFKNVYSNLSWVMQPLLSHGKQLNSCNAKLSIRINKEFKTAVISNLNHGRPMFSWDVNSYSQFFPNLNNNSTINTMIKIYPNPTHQSVLINWSLAKIQPIMFYSSIGQLVKVIPITEKKGYKIVNLEGFAQGIYFIHIGKIVKKLIVE